MSGKACKMVEKENLFPPNYHLTSTPTDTQVHTSYANIHHQQQQQQQQTLEFVQHDANVFRRLRFLFLAAPTIKPQPTWCLTMTFSVFARQHQGYPGPSVPS